ncbi:hypothetical protein, partial [Pseudomonas syringae]|uniref:hypothetical protein n=1 Tax=Pseudomonas syringae TaxID=317 RepID=UPI001F2B67AA
MFRRATASGAEHRGRQADAEHWHKRYKILVPHARRENAVRDALRHTSTLRIQALIKAPAPL